MKQEKQGKLAVVNGEAEKEKKGWGKPFVVFIFIMVFFAGGFYVNPYIPDSFKKSLWGYKYKPKTKRCVANTKKDCPDFKPVQVYIKK